MGLYPLDCPVDVIIAVWEWGAYLGEEGKLNGVRAKVSSWRRIPRDSLIPTAKAGGQYLNSILAKIEADKAGYEEAILLDTRGYVCEGTGENLFLVKDGKVATPGFANDILEGINRAAAIEILRDQGYEVVERDIARGELYRADEIFMTGTAAELTPIREVDDLDGRRRHARPGHDRDPGDLRGRAARALRALRASGSTRSPRPSPEHEHDGHRLRHHPARRDAGRGDVAVRRGEGARRAHPRRARRAHDRGRASRPRTRRSSSSSSACARRASSADVCAFGMTRRRGVAAEEDAALRVLAESWTPVVDDRRQDLGPAPREGRQGRPRREPGDDRRVRRVPRRRRQARDLRRRALLRRLPRRPDVRDRVPARRAGRGRREPDDVRHQRRVAAAPDRRGGRTSVRRALPRRRARHPHPQRRRVRRRELAGRRSPRAP